MPPDLMRNRKSTSERFEALLAFISANWFVSSLTLKRVAPMFRMHPRTARRHFRRRLDTTWTDYFLNRKLDEAARMLREEKYRNYSPGMIS